MNNFATQMSSIGNVVDLIALFVAVILLTPLCLTAVLMAIQSAVRIKKALCNKPKKLAKVENNG